MLVACQADLDFKPFSLSGVNFTCHVIILILIPPFLFFFRTDHFHYMYLQEISLKLLWETMIGEGGWAGDLQLEICDIFILFIIYSGYNV